LQLHREQEEEEEEEEEEGAAPGPTWAPPETQDFQEYLAENERAVLHLHRAQELERLQEEEDSGPGGEGGGLCVLGEHLDGPTWQVKGPPCPGLSTPLPSPGHCGAGSALLGFPPELLAQGGAQPYLAEAPGLSCAGGRGGNLGDLGAPGSCCPQEHLGVSPASKEGSPPSPPEHLEQLGLPHLPV
ncbi:CSRN2 protein, partial [Furnarius figulus]|nr:CSRN2 protein [Furnarius figulus]